MSSLPASVHDMVEMSAVEDVMLALLRARIPDIETQALIAPNQTAPLILPRRSPEAGRWRGDTRFVDAAYVDVQVFCDGDEADADAQALSEAVRVAIRDSWREHEVFPGLGHITWQEMTISPHRRPDWATATGPVQYADLPAGWVRYESTFYLEIRRPLT